MFFRNENGFFQYSRSSDDIPIGILFGHFSPFTGKKGHGRMIDYLKSLGCKKFIIGIPDTGDKLDTDRYLFTASQRKEQVSNYLKSQGLEGSVILVQTGKAPNKMLWGLATIASKTFGTNIRPIYCFGSDRKVDFENFFTEYESSDLNKYECVFLQDRGSTETSGTAVRDAIKSNDIDRIKELTGFSDSEIDFLMTTYHKNCRILQRQSSTKTLDAMGGKHHLLHLFNGNKPSQMTPLDFFQVLGSIEKNNNTLDNSIFDISEKIDGSSSFAGSDEFGFYFAKFGVSEKMRSESEVGYKYKGFFNELKDSGLPVILEDFRQQEDVFDLKVQLENVIPGASKDDTGVKTVLVSYDKSKIGKGLVIPIQVIADGIKSSKSSEVIKSVKDCLVARGFNCLESSEIKIELGTGIDCSDIIEATKPFMGLKRFSKETKLEIGELQNLLQSKILDKVKSGAFGDKFEGIVFTSKDDPSFQFKVTSEEFKNMMAIHNAKRAKESILTLRKRLSEGGNLIVNGSKGDHQATKILTQEMGKELFEELRSDLKDFFLIIQDEFSKISGVSFWESPSLLDSGKVFSGSTRTFFTKSYESYSAQKPKVGDMDVQIPKEASSAGFWDFLIANQGKTFGEFTLYGTKDTHAESQDHSLISWNKGYAEFGCEFIQIDWEYSDFEGGAPTAWSTLSHYSSWEDIENGVKGAFIKILLKATVRTLSYSGDKPFYSDKTGKKVATPKSGLSQYDFDVDAGVVQKLLSKDDGVVKIAPAANYIKTKDQKKLFQVIFNRDPEGDDLNVLTSYVRFLRKIKTEFDKGTLERIFVSFVRLLWDEIAQQLDRDLESDTEVKTIAVQKFLEIVDVLNTPEMQKKVEDAKNTYVNSENRGEGNRWKGRWQKGHAISTDHQSVRKTRRPIKESLSSDGKNLFVYSFSKDSDLFKYYVSNTLDFGRNASSAYGLAAYAILDPDQIIGYSDEQHSKLYGDNCFEFVLPSSKVFFLNWKDFVQTPLCKELGSTQETYVRDQLEYFNVDERVINNVDQFVSIEDSNGQQANNFWRIMSRYYYQDQRGSLRTPMVGFVYTGRNDGHTFVGWYAKAMIPNRVKLANGEWKDCDKSSPEFQAYINNASSYSFDKGSTKDRMRIFDGNPTPEKEGVYRLFMKASANDVTGEDSMSNGVYKNIVIHDDKTIDFTFRSNTVAQDNGVHYISLRTPLIKALQKVGYKFGKVDASLSFGSESTPIDEQKQITEMDPDLWPDAVLGSLKLAGQYLNKKSMDAITTQFADMKLFLVKCQIEEDVFDDVDEVTFKDKEGKECWTPDEETWNKLAAKYDWMDKVLKTPPEIKRVTHRDEAYYQTKIDKAQSDLEAALVALETAKAAGNEKKIAAAQKKVDKAQADIDKNVNAQADAVAKAKTKQDQIALGKADWDNHIDRIKKGWTGESVRRVNKMKRRTIKEGFEYEGLPPKESTELARENYYKVLDFLEESGYSFDVIEAVSDELLCQFRYLAEYIHFYWEQKDSMTEEDLDDFENGLDDMVAEYLSENLSERVSDGKERDYNFNPERSPELAF